MFSVDVSNDICTGVTCITPDLLSLKENADAIYEYLKVLTSYLVILLIGPHDDLVKSSVNVKHDVRTKSS